MSTHAVAVMAAHAAHRPEFAGYLRQHTTSSVLRCTFGIFFSHFRGLLPVFVLPVLPATFMQVYALEHDSVRVWAGVTFSSFVLSFFTTLVGTVAVSDICVGNQPRWKRAYKRALGAAPWRVIVTILGIWLAISVLLLAGIGAIVVGVAISNGSVLSGSGLALVGVTLAIVAPLMIATYCLLTFPVLVLEPQWGWQAVQRSARLGRGCYLRNVWVMSMCAAIVFCLQVLPASVVSTFMNLTTTSHWVSHLTMTLMSSIFMPLYCIAPVLLYYDMRVRKEAYNLDALVADLS